jgi:predicted AAA+ superfamily ATPase
MEEQNPWWIGEGDEGYERWKEGKIRWIPNIVWEFKFKPFSLHFFVGARQVGKTTALKILIHDVLLRERNPKSIFYYSCDEVLDYRELGEILDNYILARERWGVKSSIIILDEITFVEEWYRAVKSRIDRGKFRNDVLIVTGSSSIEVLKQREYFPGRRGYGKDIFFHPLSFSEYLEKFFKLELRKGGVENIEDCIDANRIFSETIMKAFNSYLVTGGFPIPIIDFFTYGRVRNESRKTYIDWLRSDWRKTGKNEKYMKEVLSYILRASGTPISWLSISKNTSLASPHTAQSYIETLENLMVLKVFNLIQPNFKVMYRRNKKIHILDPFLHNTLSYFTRVEVREDVKAESIVASHLSRVYETYYWRNKSEIDLISIVDNKQVGFEVKWGFKHYVKPRHIDKVFVLNRENLPIFLASLKPTKE